MISIDIVIPSYRLHSEYLTAVAALPVPDDVQTCLLIIADNPDAPIPEVLQKLTDQNKICLIRNHENLGASASRNKGINHSTADWILFLDDDVMPAPDLLFAYAEAIRNRPGETGFFGATIFPEPASIFTRGAVIGDMLFFFTYAHHYDETICTTTSNVLVKRKSIGELRFRDCFPKKGGGEDFAFFMELYYQTGKTLKSVKKADVFHNWWHGGRRNYSQFIRWSYADFELFRLIPDIAYRSFPNVAEALMAGLIIGLTYWIFTGSPAILIAATLGVLLGELIVVFYFLLKGKNLRKSFYAPEVMLVRAAADWGRLKGIIANRKFSDLLKRPNFTGAKAPRNFHFWPIRKFTAYIVFTIFLLWLIRTIWP